MINTFLFLSLLVIRQQLDTTTTQPLIKKLRLCLKETRCYKRSKVQIERLNS